MKPTIPIVSFAMARPFIAALEQRGVAPDPVLASAGLEREAPLTEEDYISAQTWYDLAQATATALDAPSLGYDIGSEAGLEELPNLRVLELPRATLGELLTALVIDVQRFSTIARYSLCTDGVEASLTTRRNFVPASPPAQIDGFFAGFMVRILSLCSGDAWRPDALEIGVCDPAALPGNVRREHRVQTVGKDGAHFRFPAQWLLQRTDGVARQAGIGDARGNESFLDAFRALLDPLLDRQGLTLTAFAALTGQSASTLKRRLRRHGTTYRAELDKRRAVRAKFLLRATEMTVADIGHHVGYPDPPSFGRAFKRWASVTPTDYRENGAPRTG